MNVPVTSLSPQVNAPSGLVMVEVRALVMSVGAAWPTQRRGPEREQPFLWGS